MLQYHEMLMSVHDALRSASIRVRYFAQAQPGRKEMPKWDRELPSLLVAKRVQLGARIGAVILATSALVRIFKMLWTTAYHDPATGLNNMEYRLECEAYWGVLGTTTNATEALEGYDRGAGGLPRRWRATTNETETEALEGLAVSGSFPCCSSSPHLHALLPLSRALCRSHALLTPQVSGSGCNDALMGYAILSLVPSINNVSLFVVTLLQLVFRGNLNQTAAREMKTEASVLLIVTQGFLRLCIVIMVLFDPVGKEMREVSAGLMLLLAEVLDAFFLFVGQVLFICMDCCNQKAPEMRF